MHIVHAPSKALLQYLAAGNPFISWDAVELKIGTYVTLCGVRRVNRDHLVYLGYLYNNNYVHYTKCEVCLLLWFSQEHTNEDRNQNQ